MLFLTVTSISLFTTDRHLLPHSPDQLATMCCDIEHKTLRHCFIEFSSFRNSPFSGPVSLTRSVCNKFGFRSVFFFFFFFLAMMQGMAFLSLLGERQLLYVYHNVYPLSNLWSTKQLPCFQQGGLLRMPSLNLK